MKTIRILFVLSLVFTLSSTYAQKVKTYKVWVTMMDQSTIKGTLHSAHSDELLIVGEDLNPQKIVPSDIQTIKVRRVGNVGRGAWMGAIGGLVAGAVAGYASESGSGWEDVGAVGGGILGAPAGALIGTAAGSGKITFKINGDQSSYLSLLPRLQTYAPNN